MSALAFSGILRLTNTFGAFPELILLAKQSSALLNLQICDNIVLGLDLEMAEKLMRQIIWAVL